MTRPNVLMISVDHWPGRLFGALGHPAVLTPTMDRLIENGVAFTNAYSTTPSCIPARRELHTGTLSPTHGDRVFNERLVMPDLPTLARTFRDAGYQAYAVGKLHVYPQRDRIGFDDVLLDEEGTAPPRHAGRRLRDVPRRAGIRRDRSLPTAWATTTTAPGRGTCPSTATRSTGPRGR